MRSNLFVLSTFTLLVASTASPQDTRSSSSGRKELRVALIQARDAVIEYANGDGDTNYEPDPIAKKLGELQEFLIFAGDREDIQYLRDHLKKKYANKIRDPVSVPDNREAFSKLVQAIEMDEISTQHDGALSRVISQEIDRGFLDDALAHAALLHSSSFRYQAQGSVALAAHESGNADIAQRALAATIHAATEEDSSGYPVFMPPSRKLDGLAASFLEHGYQEGARSVLLRSQQLLSTSSPTSSFDWRLLAERAIELGDLEMADRALKKLGPDDGHTNVEDSLRAARGRNMNPAQAITNAKAIVDPFSRFRSLCDIAERQASSGDKDGAAATFQLGLQATDEIGEGKVFALNEIAWAQIHSGDKPGAERTLNWALKENEQPQSGSDQEQGWAVMGDTLAYLGQFQRARETVLRISEAFDRGRGLGYVASRGIEAKRVQETIEWASKLTNPEDRSETFLRIAETMIDQLKAGPKK